MPLYPNRLLHTACQLPDRQNELFNNCFISMAFDIEDLRFGFEETNFLCIVKSLHGNFKNLLQPHLWEDHVQQKIFKLKFGQIIFTVNSVQLFTIISIAKSLANRNIEYLIDLDDAKLMSSLVDNNLVTGQFILTSANLSYVATSTTQFGEVNLKKATGYVFNPKYDDNKSLIVNWPDSTNMKDSDNVFLITVQLPKGPIVKYPPIVCFQMSSGAIKFDPMLKDFLCWEFLIKDDNKGET